MAYIGQRTEPPNASLDETTMGTSGHVSQAQQVQFVQPPASEYSTMPSEHSTMLDSGYCTINGPDRQSTGQRSVKADSVASASTVARLGIGSLQVNCAPTNPYARSDHAVLPPSSVRYLDIHDYFYTAPAGVVKGTSVTSHDTNDMCSLRGMNDTRSIAGEQYVYDQDLGKYRCCLCNTQTDEAKTTKTRSEMT